MKEMTFKATLENIGHVTAFVETALEEAGCGIFRTDRLGTIVMASDGETIRIFRAAVKKPEYFRIARKAFDVGEPM